MVSWVRIRDTRSTSTTGNTEKALPETLKHSLTRLQLTSLAHRLDVSQSRVAFYQTMLN